HTCLLAQMKQGYVVDISRTVVADVQVLAGRHPLHRLDGEGSITGFAVRGRQAAGMLLTQDVGKPDSCYHLRIGGIKMDNAAHDFTTPMAARAISLATSHSSCAANRS